MRTYIIYNHFLISGFSHSFNKHFLMCLCVPSLEQHREYHGEQKFTNLVGETDINYIHKTMPNQCSVT